MRNPRRTFRKPSRKPLSQKKRMRQREFQFQVMLSLEKWFTNYMEGLHNAQRDESAGLASIRRATR